MQPVVRRAVSALLVLAAAFLGLQLPARADRGTVEAIRARGHLVCGVGHGPKGYSHASPQGVWSGIGVDFCRALAAAVLGNKDAVVFRPLSPGEGVAALEAGRIDVLSGKLVMTSSLDTTRGIRLPGILVYDGQGFMVRKSQNIASALEFSGARICISGDAADQQAVADYFAKQKMPVELAKFERWQDAVMAYADKGCIALSGDFSTLALTALELTEGEGHVVLPEIAAKRPIGPAVRQGDEEWFSIVRWSIYALVAAEELGITAGNVDAAKSQSSAEVRHFLGLDADLGKRLGLSPDWAQRIVRQVGNYAEVFERNLGQRSIFKLERRINNLAGKGGLHHAPSFR
jgi:general L-amino acid transport system substrate-binding protein